MPADTTLLQAEYPAPVVDTTILQAEVNAGLAVAPDDGTVVPALPTLPAPLASPALQQEATGAPLTGEGPLTDNTVAQAAPMTGTPLPFQEAPTFPAAPLQEALPLPSETAGSLNLGTGPVLPPELPGPSPDAVASTQVQTDLTREISRQADLQADDRVAEAALVLQAQQTILAALKSGAGDVALLLSGLPPGATATLLGGGWVRVPPGTEPGLAEALWAFQFPFYSMEIPAVTSPTRPNPAREEGTRGGVKSQPLTAYGSRGEKEAQPGLPFASTLDILD
jgi:hypothetical protein